MAIDKSHAGFIEFEADALEESTELVQQILASTLVLSATMNPLTGATRYLVISEEFEELGADDPIPEYTINVETDDAGEPTSVTFEKV